MKSYSCLLAIISLTSFGPPLPAQAESSEDYKSKVLAEWNALLEQVNSVRGKYVMEYYSTGFHPTLDGAQLRLQDKDSYRYAYSQDGYYYERVLGKIDKSGNIKELEHVLYLRNEGYKAQLSKTRKKDGWQLTELKMSGENKENSKALSRHRAVPWLELWRGAVFVPEWLRDPSFVIARIEKIQGGAGSEFSRTHFHCDGSQLQDPKLSKSILAHQTVSGYMDFEDHLSYRIRGYAVHCKYKLAEGDREGDLVYEEGGGIPMLKVITEETPKLYNKERGWFSDRVITTYEYSYDSAPSAEVFRLSHYELPEPLGVAPLPKSHAYLWITLGAVGATAIAIFFSWMTRRRRKAQIGS